MIYSLWANVEETLIQKGVLSFSLRVVKAETMKSYSTNLY